MAQEIITLQDLQAFRLQLLNDLKDCSPIKLSMRTNG
jgi:hypothetical protein